MVVGGLWHTIASLNLLNHFAAVHSWIGHLAVGEQLHQQDAVGPGRDAYVKNSMWCSQSDENLPNIRLYRELSIDNGFRGRPLDWESGSLLGTILIVGYNSSQSKVANLGHIILANENISSCQIPVDQLFGLQVFHAARNLRRNIDEILKLQESAVALTQKVQQAALAHELLHNVNRLLFGANGIERYQTIMTELFHDCCLLQKRCCAHRAFS